MRTQNAVAAFSVFVSLRTYAAVGEPVFLEDRMRQDAIIRKLEVIGEAVAAGSTQGMRAIAHGWPMPIQ